VIMYSSGTSIIQPVPLKSRTEQTPKLWKAEKVWS
jgi:hypothetical protein